MLYSKGLKDRLKRLAFFLFLTLFFVAAGCSKKGSQLESPPLPPDTAPVDAADETTDILPVDTPLEASTNQAENTDTELQVFVFDVGQADCILLKTESHSILIDAGNIGQDDLILGYLASHGVNKLDYVVATHPHADHIGSMGGVIMGMESVGTVLMPDAAHTTNTFETLLDAIEEKDVPIEIANRGDEIVLGGMRIEALAPGPGNYADLNDYSVVLRVIFGQAAFLFSGDADAISENEQLSSGLSLEADVLKVGHHGSRTSSAQKYLDAVAPKYAVISLGKDNSYGHPHSETMDRLTGIGAEIYRTDENGTVSFVTDGETISVNMDRLAGSGGAGATAGTQPDTNTGSNTNTGGGSYIGNRNSKILHLPTCRTLPQESNRVYFDSRDEALNQGYRPCNNCNP